MKFYFSHINNSKIFKIAKGFESVVPECFFWNREELSLFDLIQEQNPSAVFLNDEDNTDHVKYAKHEFPNVKFVLLTEKEENVEGFDLILNISNKLSKQYVPNLSADINTNGGKFYEQYKCDFVIISNRLDPNNKSMVNWISSLGNSFNLKVYGDTKLPTVNYLGKLMPEQYRDVFQSCKAVIMMDDEWYYDTILNGKIPIVYSREKNNPWEFNTYEDVVSSCNKVLDIYESSNSALEDMGWWKEESEKAKDKTYENFANKIKEGLNL